MLFKKSYFGIDIYDNAIKIMQLSGKSATAGLRSYSNLELPSKIVDNGKIINKKILIEKIKQAINQAQPKKISIKNCIFALPESQLILSNVKISKKTDKENFDQEILKKIQTTIPFEPSEIYYDYRTILNYKNNYEILFIAVQKNILNDFITVFQNCQLELKIVDFESACLARSLITHCNMNDIYAIIDIGGRTTIVSIYDFCNIRFTHNIPIAGKNFTQAIASKWNLFFQEAEEFKKAYGLDPLVEEGKVHLVLQKSIQQLLDVIKKDIDYYQEKTNRKISKIIFCGGSSQMPKISKYFIKNLDIKTEIGDPFSRIKDKINIPNKIQYAAVAGLALRGLEKKPEKSGINLLNNT